MQKQTYLCIEKNPNRQLKLSITKDLQIKIEAKYNMEHLKRIFDLGILI